MLNLLLGHGCIAAAVLNSTSAVDSSRDSGRRRESDFWGCCLSVLQCRNGTSAP